MLPLVVQLLAVCEVPALRLAIDANCAGVTYALVLVQAHIWALVAAVLLGGSIQFVPSYVRFTILPTAISPLAGSFHSYVFIDFATSPFSARVHAHVFATSALKPTLIPVVYAASAGARLSE